MTASFRVSPESSKEELLTKIDGQKRQIAKLEDKTDRQRTQIAKLSDNAAERNRTIAAQDRLIAEQGEQIQELRAQLARLQGAAQSGT